MLGFSHESITEQKIFGDLQNTHQIYHFEQQYFNPYFRVDFPFIYCERVFPIQNQPTLVLTIGRKKKINFFCFFLAHFHSHYFYPHIAMFLLYDVFKKKKKGAPGSGKTSWCNGRYGKQYVISADEYFEEYHDGQFVPQEIGNAHSYCEEKMFAYLQDTENYPCVCVANTHTHWWELYSKIVTVVLSPETPQLEFPHKIVFVVMPEQNTKAMAQRCAHDVPKFKIETMTHQIFREMLQNGTCIPTIQHVLQAGGGIPKSIRKKQLSSVFGQ
ncbi:nedd4-binding protein, partial [Reticulomyxa filosa]